MGWIERLVERGARAAFERVRQSPRFQEIERENRLASPVVTVSRLLAGSPADDEAFSRRLRGRLNVEPEAVAFALERLQTNRGDFLDDRAYRILYAAANDTAVAPVDPQHEQELQAQEELARLPLREAFAFLAERAPGLRTLEARLADGHWRQGTDDSGDLFAYLNERVAEVLKSSGNTESPLLSSRIAHVVAQRYLMLITGADGVIGDLDSPFLPVEDIKI